MVDLIRVGVGAKGATQTSIAGRGLLAHDPVSVGRATGCAVRIEHAWMPRRLVTVVRDGDVWSARNGDRTRCRITASGVEAMIAPGRRMLLEEGDWRLRWPELDNAVDVRVTLGSPDEEERGSGWPVLADTHDRGGGPRAHAGTQLAGEDLDATLTPLRRYRLAHVFRHVLEEEPEPTPFFPPAAAAAGCSVQVLKNLVRDVEDLLNRQRGLELQGNAALGYYLVHTTGVLRPEHLTAPRSGGEELPR